MKSIAMAAFAAALFAGPFTLHAADAKTPPKAETENPLSKFKEEDLLDVGFCFDKFCEAIASKDAKTAAAFMDHIPKGLGTLDLSKEADKEKFLKAMSGFSGAQIVKAQKYAMAGAAEITYTDASGAEKTVRMQKAGPMWKIIPP